MTIPWIYLYVCLVPSFLPFFHSLLLSFRIPHPEIGQPIENKDEDELRNAQGCGWGGERVEEVVVAMGRRGHDADCSKVEEGGEGLIRTSTYHFSPFHTGNAACNAKSSPLPSSNRL